MYFRRLILPDIPLLFDDYMAVGNKKGNKNRRDDQIKFR